MQVQGGSKVSISAHAELMQMGTHTAEKIPWHNGQGGVVDWTALVEPMGGLAMRTTSSDCVRDQCLIVIENFMHVLLVIVQ